MGQEKSHIALEMEQLMNTVFGRSFLRRLLLDQCGVFSSPHHPDPHAASYQMGRQAIGLLVLADLIEADPSAITILLTEEKVNAAK